VGEVDGCSVQSQHHSEDLDSCLERHSRQSDMGFQRLQRHRSDLSLSMIRHVWLGVLCKGQAEQRLDHSLRPDIDTTVLACLVLVRRTSTTVLIVTYDLTDDVANAQLESRSGRSIHDTISG
jgi:hypothetical protein